MANAKKCDRCGKLYEHYNGKPFIDDGYEYNWVRIYTTHGSAWRDFDLCPDCMTKLIALLKMESNEVARGYCDTCKHNGGYPSKGVCINCKDFDGYERKEE